MDFSRPVLWSKLVDRPPSILRLHTIDGVRFYRSWMRPDRLQSIQAARSDLANVRLPCPLTLLPRDGSSWIEVDGHMAEIEPIISFDRKMNAWDRLEQGLRLLSRLHDRLLTLVVPEDGSVPRPELDRSRVRGGGGRQGAARLRDVDMSDDELNLYDAS